MPHLWATYGLKATKGKTAVAAKSPKSPIVLLVPKAGNKISGIGDFRILPLMQHPPQVNACAHHQTGPHQ
jgi:hypothetical protein